jgi:hypothetical protein
MAKKDPFEKFRQATLGGETESPLQAALSQEPKAAQPIDNRVPVRPAAPVAAPVQAPTAQPEKVSKNEKRELVSFHLEKELKRLLGYIKFDTGKSYNDLYCEAVEDLLKKYGKL